MRRGDRLGALAGFVYVLLYVAAFSLGIEVGRSDREILEYYGESGHRTKEVVAFFLLAAAALAFVVFAGALRARIAAAERAESDAPLAAFAWAGAILAAALSLAGNAVSRAAAFTAMDDPIDPNGRRLLEDAGLLLFASGAIAAGMLVVAVGIASLRLDVLPRWLGWMSFVVAPLLPLAIVFLGFVVLWVWVLTTSVVLALGRSSAAEPGGGAAV